MSQERQGATPARWGADLQTSLFAKGRAGRRATTMPAWRGDAVDTRLPAGTLRAAPADLPSLSEPEVLRHYTLLSNLNHHIERGLYPLGSCTMKYNPRLNEKVAALSGFASLHPEQDEADLQGLLCALKLLQDALCEITGFAACSLQPAAGAHGEYLGMQVIRARHLDRGESGRTEVLIPDSAHGTNPASVVLTGMKPRTLKSGPDGRLDLAALRAAVGPQTAGIMITNPNTLGLFECDIVEVARIVHDAGGLLYMDGANLNAILGKAKPALMGFDVVHLNLHKTFSTPHGGGGPGAGPVGVAERVRPFLPISRVRTHSDGTYHLDYDAPKSIGYIAPFYGNFGILVRAYAYLRMLGREGLRETSDMAVLNANYIQERLRPHFAAVTPGRCMHECVFSGKPLGAHGVHTLDLAKALIDRGIHPPTVYFPLNVPEAVMIEPTESESRETLDRFCEAMIELAGLAEKDPDALHRAPETMPVGRLDEVAAAKRMDLAYTGAPAAG